MDAIDAVRAIDFSHGGRAQEGFSTQLCLNYKFRYRGDLQDLR